MWWHMVGKEQRIDGQLYKEEVRVEENWWEEIDGTDIREFDGWAGE